MPQIWLMRHGQAEDPDTAASDRLRQLTPQGRQQVTAMGRWLASRAERPELILHSPLVRTTETAELIAGEWAAQSLLLPSDLLAPGMRAASLLRDIEARQVQSVLCVGHQPDIGQAMHAFLGSGHFQVAPGTLAGFQFPASCQTGDGVLVGYLDPAWFL